MGPEFIYRNPVLDYRAFIPWIATVAVWFMSESASLLVGACDSQAYIACGYNISLHMDQEQRVFPYFDDDNLHFFCSLEEEARHCLQPISAKCNKQERTLHEGRMKEAEHLCSTGYETYREVRDCFTLSAVHEAALNCLQIYKEKAKKLHSHNADQLCGFLNEWINCTSDGAEVNCKGSGQWLYEMYENTMQPAKEAMGCSDYNRKQKSITLPVTLGCLSVFLLLFVLVLIYNRKRLKHTRRRSHLSNSVSRARKSSFNASKSYNETQTTQPFVVPPPTTEQSVCTSTANNASHNSADGNDTAPMLPPAAPASSNV